MGVRLGGQEGRSAGGVGVGRHRPQGSAGQVGALPSGLTHQQGTGGYVPGVAAAGEGGIERSGGHQANRWIADERRTVVNAPQ